MIHTPTSPATITRPSSIVDAAALVGVHPTTLRAWIDDGTLPAYRVGPRLIRVSLDDVEALVVPITPSRR